MVTVRADGNYENETFLFNYITKAEYDAISGDKTAGLKDSYGRIYRCQSERLERFSSEFGRDDA